MPNEHLKQMIRDGEESGLYMIQELEHQLESVKKLHAKETRYMVDSYEGKSWESMNDIEDWFGEEDMPAAEEIGTFDVCSQCFHIEYFARGFDYIGDLSSWPCVTAQIWEN